MYPGTKLDVDRHVEDCLRKINNETERNLRCFGFAKQYFQVERYEDARRYVSTYLSAKPNSAEGHYLLGRCLEMLGKKDDAVRAYSTSLSLEPKKNNLVIKICELLADDEVELDQSGAKYFCDLAQSIDPHNPAVFGLKQKLITSQNDDPKDVSNLLLKELELRPADVKLRVRLLKHLIQHNMIKEAYKHATDIESKDLPIFYSSSWYETVAEVLVKYQKTLPLNSDVGWEFWFLSVSILDKIAALSLDEHSENIKTSNEYIGAVFNFDQTLAKASQNLDGCPDRHLVQQFLNHFRAQLCFHFVTLILKQANKDLIKYKEASNITLPLLFASYHSQPPDLQSLWFNHAPENRRNLVKRWRKEGAFRCSQVGHILLSQAKDRKSIVLEKAAQYSTGSWKEQLFKKIFITRDQQLKMPTSYFLTNDLTSCDSSQIIIRLPDKEELGKYDEEAQLLYPNSLHYLIWIVLNNKLSDWNLSIFEGLQYSIKQLKNCGAETLNILDLQAFVTAAAVCARASIENSRNISFYNADKPSILPAAITPELGTLNQNAFFKAAYQMYRNEYGSGMDQLRLILVEGIKIIRCVDHGLNVKLLVTLAKTFAERAKKLTKQSEIDFNETRAELYWKAALPLLEKLKNDQIISYAPNKLFNYKSKDLSLSEIVGNMEAGKLFSGCQLMKKKEYEKALRILEVLKDPYASFYQAQIYKLMADLQTSQNKENVTSEMRSQNIILLSKARDCLYLTLDRLREPRVDQNHPLNTQLGTEIEKMERLLARIDPDCNNRNECDGMSDDNVSSNDSAGDHYITGYPTQNTTYFNGTFTPSRGDHNLHSTPFGKKEARPSPERLDAQLRQLATSKDAAISQILEHNKIMVESQRTLVDELRSFKDAVHNLTSTIEDLKKVSSNSEELKEIKKSINELKTSIEELDNFKNVTDMMHEMKKEIQELKKDVNKTSQLSEEDIYGLTNDYATDYNINPNLPAYNPNMFANYQGRVQPAAAAPPGSIYGTPPMGFPGLYHPTMAYYGGLGLSQVPGMAPDPLTPDFRAISAALQQQQQQQPNAYAPPAPPQLTQAPTASGLGMLAGPPPSLLNQTTPTYKASSASTRAPPVNVVITTSDPLPLTNKLTTTQPILSVTIPPQHLKGGKVAIQQPQPHNYQIPLPPSTMLATTSPSVLSKPPPAVTTQSLLMNVAPPVYSALADSKPNNVTLGLQIEKSLDQSFKTPTKADTSNISTSSLDEHDPCPDFKPIIPLPDEVPVTTGEENETVLFSERAKLFRYSSKNGTNEWKERGVGVLKILENPETGKIRLLMRRDQVHKICANHFLTADMKLSAKDERAYMWAAHDYADEEVVVEKLCARFKSAEEAVKFKEAFEKALAHLEKIEKTPVKSKVDKEPPKNKETVGGFVFSTTPILKSMETSKSPIVKEAPQKASPFAGFSFSPAITITPISKMDFKPVPKIEEIPVKPTDDEKQDDFVPTAEFKPVVPLPELIEIKTGEEDCDVLFESRAKLLRFDTSGETKEWKERGTGVMKILKDNAANSVRLLMRRDQVHKVCCNHQLLKSMNFASLTNNPKAVTWCAKDFSEGVLKLETFAIRFKNEELASKFLNTIKSSQEMLSEENGVSSSNKHMKSEPKVAPPTNQGFGDKFKPVKGSWECKNCYIVNDGKDNYCMACETPKSGAMPQKNKDNSSGAAFSFGVTGRLTSTASTTSWGSAFQPKEGTWECKTCYIRNDGDKTICVSCETPKDGTLPVKKAQEKGVDLDTGGLKFNFGVPAATSTTPKTTWGPSFKPKPGSWECQTCLIRNNAEVVQCVSCGTSKDGTVNRSEVSSTTSEQKFKFGMPAATQADTKATFTFGQTTITPQFAFGNTMGDSGFKFEPAVVPTAEAKKEDVSKSGDQFVFGSPQKHDFEFAGARSPRRISTGQKDEESDCSYVEEEADNIYFKPVIPLPDKVDVKTGEEDEDVIYCQRAKLFRFTAGEWKERGLGDLKILRRQSNGKLRVLMRREQVFKICLNHVLTDDIKYMAKDEKTWLFSAPDYSDGEISNEKFCVRFKNADIAQEFLKAVNDALGSAPDSTKDPEPSETSDDPVEVVYETEVTPEEEQEALKLQLPPKFMSYRQLPDCSCDQCKKDDLYLKELFDNKKTTQPTGSSTPNSEVSTLKSLLSKPSLIAANNKTPASSTSSLFGTPLSGGSPLSKSNATVFGTPVSDAKSTFSFNPSDSGASSFFGKSENNIFTGVSSTTGGSIFGGSAGNNVFVTPTTTAANSGSIFGGKSVFGTAASSSPSIFGGGTTTTSGGIFGLAKSESGSPSIFANSGNIFGAKASVFGSPAQTTGSLFGGTTSSTGSIFGSVTTPTATSGNIFGTPKASISTGGSIFGSPSPATTTTGSIFGGTSNVFGSTATSSSSIFGKSKETESIPIVPTTLSKEDAPVLDSPSGISFATLAAKVNPNAPPAFAATTKDEKKDEKSSPFAFLGAGAPVFGRTADKNKSIQDGDDGATADDEYDPHYDPIVPLPDAIVVSTGEEDETAVFNERAKLYRYDADTKEWKERGVGQMKILFHPVNKTCRFLLRREQVHKVVLNQLITPDLDLQPMTTSDKAWVWAGHNYLDDGPVLEKLAVRFKNCDLAHKFQVSVNEIKNLQEKDNVVEVTPELELIPSTIENYGHEDVSSEEHHEEDDEDDDDDEDDRSIMFSKRCTLFEEVNGTWQMVTMGDICVYYDSDYYAERICVSNDSGLIVSNTLIGMNTVMEIDNNDCIWKAVDWADAEPRWRKLRAAFSSNSAATEFHLTYHEGLNYAQEFDVIDELPGEHHEETDD